MPGFPSRDDQLSTLVEFLMSGANKELTSAEAVRRL